MQFFWARLASFSHLCLISDTLMVSKFHNGIYDSKGQENKIYTTEKDMETFYRRHTVPVTSSRKSAMSLMSLKRLSFGNKNASKKWKCRVCSFLGQTSWFQQFRPLQWTSDGFKVTQWNPWFKKPVDSMPVKLSTWHAVDSHSIIRAY